jgi:DNA-binding transcriptional regulator YhcF (GntR family)
LHAAPQVVSQQNIALKSKVAEWALSLPVNQATSASQRELAVQLGVSLRAVQKALKVLADRRVVTVVTTSSGTVVTRLK